MNTVDDVRESPAVMSTAERIERAWWQASLTVQKGALAGVLISAEVSHMMRAERWEESMLGITGAVLAIAALVDVHERRLPNRLMLIAAATSLAGPALSLDLPAVVRTIVGGLIAGGAMLLVALLRGLGMGDVKMGAVVGASAGSMALIGAPIAIAIAATVASVYGLVARRRQLALGPALWFGWAAALFGLSMGWWR